MTRPSGPGPTDPTPLDPSSQGSFAEGDILLVAGDGQLSTHTVARGELVIGRGADCDVVIDHPVLSRRHAVLRIGPPATVQDLGSTNGTRVGAVVHTGGAAIELGPGEGFYIGPFAFMRVARTTHDPRSISARDLLRIVDPTPGGVPTVVRDIARSGANVLVLGETGVGKEVLAATLHELSGRTGMFARINCAALSETLLESELFGHEKGAFTGAAAQRAGLLESADGGTVFLDEVGELVPSIQAKLLRAVEHREVLRIGATRPIPVDVRFLAATNRDLAAAVAAGSFRPDLLFRLDGVTLEIPPLRERRGLIGPLALKFLADAAARARKPSLRLDAQVLAALEAHPWPGNVRELKAVIERAVLLVHGGELGVRHLAFGRHTVPDPRPATAPERARPPTAEPPATTGPGDFSAEEQADRDRVLRALDECAGNQTRAAKHLGISRTSLVTKLRLYRIPRPRT
jgi:two-component system, NtrC family, response regulator AtoC